MKDFFTLKIAAMALTFLVGPLTYIVVRNVKAFWVWLDTRPAWMQRVFVIGVAFGLTAAAQALGFALPGECQLIGDGLVTDSCKSALADPVFIKAVLSAGVAMLMHTLKKSEPDT